MKNVKLALKNDRKTVIPVGNCRIGAEMTLIAGPCSVENEEQMFQTAEAVKEGGAQILRGGAYKPRTSPYAFQGLGLDGVKLLKAAGDTFDMPIITELMDIRDLEDIHDLVDIIQVGARNMQNFTLLKELGKIRKPILLKRGMNATVEEFLNCAEYLLYEGNDQVILCERGIRTFENYTRNTLDLGAVAALKTLTHLPVIVDPSHGTGKRELVKPMSLAAAASGADGITVEVHYKPETALSDGDQSLTPEMFHQLAHELNGLSNYLMQA